MKYIIHTDGGSRGNPGQAGIGVVIEMEVMLDHGSKIQAIKNSPASIIQNQRSLVASFGKTIGITTNNVAEYTAVIEALKWVINNIIIQYSNNPINNYSNNPIHKSSNDLEIQFYLDSTLVVNQINGLFKVKDANMRMLMLNVRELEQQISGTIRYAYVPREENSAADFQVNKALDGE